MKQVFVASLCRGGILGGGIVAGEDGITFKTGKVTVPSRFRNLEMKYRDIRDFSRKRVLGFPVFTHGGGAFCDKMNAKTAKNRRTLRKKHCPGNQDVLIPGQHIIQHIVRNGLFGCAGNFRRMHHGVHFQCQFFHPVQVISGQSCLQFFVFVFKSLIQCCLIHRLSFLPYAGRFSFRSLLPANDHSY